MLREARGRADAMAALRARGPPALLALLSSSLPPLAAPDGEARKRKSFPSVAARAAAALLGAAQKVGSVETALHLLAALLAGEAGCHVALAAADAAGLEV